MKCCRREVQARWLLLVALVLACSGCTLFKKSPQAADKPMETKRLPAVEETTKSNQDLPFFHQVRWEGETLSIIAKWYTGDWRNWQALAKVNPWVEPNNMFTGMKVKIPRQLLKNQKAMPREFVLSSASQNKAGAQTKEVSQQEAPAPSVAGEETKGTSIQFVVP